MALHIVYTTAVVDGLYNIVDGITGMTTACADKSYDGAVSETTKAIAKKAGATKEQQKLAGAIASASVGLVETVATGGVKFAKGACTASQIAKTVDRTNDIAGKAQTINSVTGVYKASDDYSKTETGKTIVEHIMDMNASDAEKEKLMNRYYEHH